MSPRFDPATAAELSRIGLFGSLPGEVLNRIAGELTREDVPPGRTIDTADRFVVLLRGMASGPAGMLRPGASLGPGGGALRPISPVTIVWCDRSTYEEQIRPHAGG